MQISVCGRIASSASVIIRLFALKLTPVLVLHDKTTTKIELKGYSYLRGCIDCRNKFLPLEFEIKDKNSKTEFLVGFNSNPNQVKNDLKFYNNEFVIGTESQKLLTKDYSIKFMLLAINTLDTEIRISFKGLRPCRYIRETPRFEKIDYFRFKNFELELPEVRNDYRNQDQIDRNLDMIKIYNPNFKQILSKRATMEYDFKRKLAKQRRA
jgi:hypothetical protein